MALITPGFTFSHQRLSCLDLTAFSESFHRLAPDQHVDGNYRSRRYSQFTGPATALKKLDHESFIQSKKVNYLNGDIERQFSELDSSLVSQPQFEQLIQTVSHFFGFNPNKTTLGVHQIRVTCSGHEKGLPVPEGIHQDGFDLIAICCIARHNVQGAETELFNNPAEKAVYACTMQPGDIIYCNDRKMYHYASPIEVGSNEEEGYRDIFVITVSLNGQQWQETTSEQATNESDNNFQPLPA